jgi:HEAT repeat protein
VPLTKAEIDSASEDVVLARLAEPGLTTKEHRRVTLRLCNVATPASMPMLRELLVCSDAPARLRAVLILAGWENDEATEALISALQSPHSDVVGSAAMKVVKRDARHAVPELVEVLETRGPMLAKGDRRMVVRALALMPHRSAVPALDGALRSPRADQSTRKWAARGLAATCSPDSRAALESAARELGWWRGRWARKMLPHAQG